MPRLHFGDLVSCECHVNGEDLRGKLFNIIGIKRIGELAEYGGVWSIMDIKTDKIYHQVLGNYLSVWGVVSPSCPPN